MGVSARTLNVVLTVLPGIEKSKILIHFPKTKIIIVKRKKLKRKKQKRK
jgi:hypothetical protein